jgi:hypothetical protein
LPGLGDVFHSRRSRLALPHPAPLDDVQEALDALEHRRLLGKPLLEIG